MESEPEPASGACFSFSERAVAKAEREEACWDGTKSRRHVVHVRWRRRAKKDGNLTRQVQSKVSQILNKSKGAWKAFSLLRALSSRMTDQAQVEAEDLRIGHVGRNRREGLSQLRPHSRVFQLDLLVLFWTELWF